MKITETRPCDNCDTADMIPLFYVLRISQALYNPRSVQQTMGINMMLGGAIQLAEVLSPDPEAITVLGDKEKGLQTELHLCHDCVLTKNLNVGALIQKVADREERVRQAAEE